jgi:hypothetical protein
MMVFGYAYYQFAIPGIDDKVLTSAVVAGAVCPFSKFATPWGRCDHVDTVEETRGFHKFLMSVMSNHIFIVVLVACWFGFWRHATFSNSKNLNCCGSYKLHHLYDYEVCFLPPPP